MKRLIAVGGDWVRPQGDKYATLMVPKGFCWVEGDNYGVSGDSNQFGPVSSRASNIHASRTTTHSVWCLMFAREISLRLSRSLLCDPQSLNFLHVIHRNSTYVELLVLICPHINFSITIYSVFTIAERNLFSWRCSLLLYALRSSHPPIASSQIMSL